MVALLLALLCAPVLAGDDPHAEAAPAFERYAFVLLKSGDKADDLPEAELKEIQAAHLGHLGKMAEDGKMVLAGPFAEQQDKSLRGFCLYRTSLDEARELANADPAVKAGRLKVEVMDWWTEKGAVAFPMADPMP